MVINQRTETTGDYSMEVGIGEFKVVAVNPTADEMNKLLGTDKIEKEPVYVKEKDGVDEVTITFWVENIKTGKKYPYRFPILNKEKVWEKSGKTVWINQTGGSATVMNKEDLQTWFTGFTNKDKEVIAEKGYKKALVGEQELYAFMRNWISKCDYFAPSTDIFLDRKKLFRGNVSELKDLIGSELVDTVILALYVAIVDKDGETKQYQNIWKESLPGYQMKKINLSIQQGSWDSDKVTKNWKDSLTGEYGIRGAFLLDHIQKFDESKHINATNEVIRHSTDTTEAPTDTSY